MAQSTPRTANASQSGPEYPFRIVWGECPRCKGTGMSDLGWDADCPRCHGTGQVRRRITPAERKVTSLVQREKSTPRIEGHPALKARFHWHLSPTRKRKTPSSEIEGAGNLCGCPVQLRVWPVEGNPRKGYKVSTRVHLPDGKILYGGTKSSRFPRLRGGARKALRWALGDIRRSVARHTKAPKAKKVA
jgi:hypothetical protein